MAYATIGQDIAIQYTLGALANGQAITFGAASSVKAIAKRVEIDEEALESDVSALGDGLEINRFRRVRAKVRLTMQANNTGRLFYGYTGYAIKVENKILSSLATFETFVGGIKTVSTTEEDGENLEVIEVIVGIEGWTYTGVYS